ncbi:uncharacterized protein LOC126906829 isoform X1 [Daktulosphaira vitifoliae]|uniref:uncharacterized protein LOC126906829 isoform X1 n=1 Tax=Daktulosphaira vitifoliae TaxID=58002 RepID=UPI0021A9AA50|nr:uncharacterized protein LOC126906829 isoform X1 [Daktulosphaira vitifoliae]
MNYSTAFIFFLLSLATNGQPEIKGKKFTIKFLNSFLQSSKWRIAQRTMIDYKKNEEKIRTDELLIDEKNCYRGAIVDNNNVEDKLRKTILLVNIEYSVSFAWIVYHLNEINCDCSYYRDTLYFPRCVELIKSSIAISKHIIIRFISAINFLMTLLDIDTKPSILDILQNFITLVNQVKHDEKNDNTIMKSIDDAFRFKFTYEKNVYEVLKSQSINKNDLDFFNPVLYEIDINLNKEYENYTYFEYIEMHLRNYIEYNINRLYNNLGFSYNEETKITSYVYNWEQ